MKTKIAAILARVSRPTQNMESQVSDLMRVATEMGYTVPSKFIFKEQISGINSGRKESLERILSALENKKNDIQAVFIWEITRLNRDAMDFTTELNEFIKRNTPVYFLDAELWSMNPDTKELLRDNTNQLIGASIYGLKEWEKIAQRTKRGRDAVAEKGLYVGHVADGYIALPQKDSKHKTIEVDDNRKGVIEEIFKLFVGGHSTNEIASLLNAKGIPTTAHYRVISEHFKYNKTYRKRKGDIEYDRSDTKWSGTSISTILSNTWYVGKRYYNGKEYNVKSIISDELWEKAKELRESRAINFRSNRKSIKHNYLLRNLVFCGECGRKFYGHYTGKNNHYFCSSAEEGKKCGTRGINKERFEAIVCGVIRNRAVNSLLDEESHVTADFFKLEESEKNIIRTEISNKQTIINSLKVEAEKLEQQRKELFRLMSLKKEDETIINGLLLENAENKLNVQHQIENNDAEIMMLRKKINADANIKALINNIVYMNNLDELRKLVEYTVKSIVVYTIDKSINYVLITYMNDKSDNFIYSYNLLRNSYLSLPLNGFVRADIKNKVLQIKDNSYITFEWPGFNRHVLMLLENEDEVKFAKQHNIKLYHRHISFRDFVMECRDTSLKLLYDPTPFIENDERRKIQAKKEKEYQARRNNGLPTTLPYVVRDGNYEAYMKDRKRFYNRRNKIKKNKRLTAEDKKCQLQEISRQLALLRAKVKYLSREEAVQKYKKSQSDNK